MNSNVNAPEKLINIIKNGHFVASKVPTYFNQDPVSIEMQRQLEIARKDFLLPIKPGCWLISAYHVPNDIATVGAQEFNWDNIYVAPDEYNIYLDSTKSSNIRFGLPVGEEFVPPKKRQYYGHPALYDLENLKTIKNISDIQKRGLKKTYELNQIRLLNLQNSVFMFMSYNISHHFSKNVFSYLSDYCQSPNSIINGNGNENENETLFPYGNSMSQLDDLMNPDLNQTSNSNHHQYFYF